MRARFLLTWIDEANWKIVGSFLVAWCAYIGAEAFHVSGVLATVSCGLIISYFKNRFMPPQLLAHAIAVWDFAVCVLESLAFVLIGLSLRGILQSLHAEGLSYITIVPIIAAIAAAVALARFAWMVPHAWWDGLRSRLRSLPHPVPNPGLVAVAGSAGMRGVVSLAAALALPFDFPERNSIIAIAFGVILTTVLGQATTLAPLARWLGIAEHEQSSATRSG